MTQIIIILLSMLTGSTQPYSVPEYLDAIVATGHGSELFWYTPKVRHYLPDGAPANVKGATNCWPPQFSGVVYLSPNLPAEDEAMTVAHELVHLANNCHGSEHEVELAAMDALAYLGRRQDVIRNVVDRLDGCVHPVLPAAVVAEYYCKPAYTMLFGDMTNYPYLYRLLLDVGVREYVSPAGQR